MVGDANFRAGAGPQDFTEIENGRTRVNGGRACKTRESRELFTPADGAEHKAFSAMKGLFQDSAGQFNVKRTPDLELASASCMMKATMLPRPGSCG